MCCHNPLIQNTGLEYKSIKEYWYSFGLFGTGFRLNQVQTLRGEPDWESDKTSFLPPRRRFAFAAFGKHGLLWFFSPGIGNIGFSDQRERTGGIKLLMDDDVNLFIHYP